MCVFGSIFVNILYVADADMEDYGFEYSDEEQEEQDVDIENQYYNSKGFFMTFNFENFWMFVSRVILFELGLAKHLGSNFDYFCSNDMFCHRFCMLKLCTQGCDLIVQIHFFYDKGNVRPLPFGCAQGKTPASMQWLANHIGEVTQPGAMSSTQNVNPLLFCWQVVSNLRPPTWKVSSSNHWSTLKG